MDANKIEELQEKYKKQFQNLDSEGLRQISTDRSKAEEYAKKGIETVEPKNLNYDYIQTVANTMQLVAKMLLEERSKN